LAATQPVAGIGAFATMFRLWDELLATNVRRNAQSVQVARFARAECIKNSQIEGKESP
jgi:hypothetical protein